MSVKNKQWSPKLTEKDAGHVPLALGLASSVYCTLLLERHPYLRGWELLLARE